jgi:PAS domain S-box-containing protein
MDAIVELDPEFHIRLVNPAAERIFGCLQDRLAGKPLGDFMESKDVSLLKQVAAQLGDRPPGRRSIWITQGLVAVSADKRRFSAEATLSQLETKGRYSYLLILRDVDERLQAQKLIDALRGETEYLRDTLRSLYNFGEIIGQSRPVQKTLQLVAEVAPTEATVLIYGETGTGKELIARAIHEAGERRSRPLITVNCAAIPESLMESEFFGHEKGAFTGATQRREGRFALADGGTIFLDEIGELNGPLQAKLLRVLQDGEYTPVGAAAARHTDVRVIAATNRDLSRAVQEGAFRTDLYYRLNVFPINLPPLRERGDDILLLARYFVAKFATETGRRIDPLSTECIERLQAYEWPGNVRELRNIIERGVITARQGRLNLEHALPQRVRPAPAPVGDGNGARTVLTVQQLQQIEKKNLLLALETSGWRIAGENGASRLMGLPPSTLQSRMKALGIRRPR